MCVRVCVCMRVRVCVSMYACMGGLYVAICLGTHYYLLLKCLPLRGASPPSRFILVPLPVAPVVAVSEDPLLPLCDPLSHTTGRIFLLLATAF